MLSKSLLMERVEALMLKVPKVLVMPAFPEVAVSPAMVEPPLVGIANIHARAFSDRFN